MADEVLICVVLLLFAVSLSSAAFLAGKYDERSRWNALIRSGHLPEPGGKSPESN